MDNVVTFKRVKSIVFGKNDEDFFDELNNSGYFNKNWNNKVKELIKSDFYGSKEKPVIFTQDQESVIVDIIKKYIKNVNSSYNDEVVVDKENIDKSKEALQALSTLQRFRKK